MAGLEARKVALQGELASAQTPAPRLHPGLAQIYRDRVAELARVLGEEVTSVNVVEIVDGLEVATAQAALGGSWRVSLVGGGLSISPVASTPM